MTNYTIENFWQPRLKHVSPQSATPTEGWLFIAEGLSTFKEAPLTRSAEIPFATNPETSDLLIVSAPGAVGKSTLARQIAFSTGAVYIDLAVAAPVGGNTLSGGLVRSGLYDAWKAGSTAVLIDGLDEARLRVTQPAFEAFLSDIAEISKQRTAPTILFGRTGAAQDSWLILESKGVDAPVLEIGFYGPEASLDFAELRLRAINPDGNHAVVQRKALSLLLNKLRSQTETDGDRFAGYAPVLQAVAERVAKETNPAALVAEIEKGAQPVTLQTIVAAILERERGKLATLPFQTPAVADTLYSQSEQLERLIARIYKRPPPPLPRMGPKDAQIYASALDTWVPEHPFLDGNVDPSSLVFDAIIATSALRNASSAQVALDRELRRGAAANPFLSEFYMSKDEHQSIPPEHIGVIYTSLRARLSLGDTASLLVEGVEDGVEEEALRAEVEITLARRGTDRPRVIQFQTDQTGPVRLGPHVEDVEITVPHSTVEIDRDRKPFLLRQ